ncbi:MAG: hypothetical protein FJZ01_13370 [Candidatus Sericytochromatia bacterium]|nr:hypothetical protein [Candidatus Tanganyikabacteria bacterium]
MSHKSEVFGFLIVILMLIANIAIMVNRQGTPHLGMIVSELSFWFKLMLVFRASFENSLLESKLGRASEWFAPGTLMALTVASIVLMWMAATLLSGSKEIAFMFGGLFMYALAVTCTGWGRRT